MDSPQPQARRYLWTFLGLTCAGLLGVVSLNGFADPFRVFGVPRYAGFNDRTPDVSGFDRLAKPYEILHVRPRTVLLGSSTAHSGFLALGEWDMALPKPAYNYALLGASAHEVRGSLTQALRECPVEVAVVIVDFFTFNAHYRDNERFDPVRLEAASRQAWPGYLGADLAAFLFGRDASALSWKTVTTSYHAGANSVAAPWWQDYPWQVHFRNCERSYLHKWFPAPARRYELTLAEGGPNRLDDYDAMLRLCGERGVRLIVICPPIHARFQEALAAAGVWPQYESWKRELARRTQARQALRGSSEQIELWDFSLFNEATCEALPEDGGPRMLFFSDSAHFTPELGRLVLDEIFSAPPRFGKPLGVRLDRVDIDEHLASLRTELSAFRTANPSVVADVRAAIGANSAAGPVAAAAAPR